MAGSLCNSLLAKIHDQIDLTEHLIAVVPIERLHWSPPIKNSWPLAMLLGHLAACMSGFCAVLGAVLPEALAHFQQLREPGVVIADPLSETSRKIALYRAHIDEGFDLLRDANLAQVLPTLFVKSGETVLTLLLNNLEHLINHKHQLFVYLQLLGVEVNSRDLYRFRADS